MDEHEEMLADLQRKYNATLSAEHCNACGGDFIINANQVGDELFCPYCRICQ